MPVEIIVTLQGGGSPSDREPSQKIQTGLSSMAKISDMEDVLVSLERQLAIYLQSFSVIFTIAPRRIELLLTV